MAGTIIKVSGPLVVAQNMRDTNMYDVVKVGREGLVGEIVEIKNDLASIQVYEETGGLGPGDPVVSTGHPLSVELGPGLIESIFDGIQRSLDMIYLKSGNMIKRGIDVPSLNRDKNWRFQARVKKGDQVIGGDILGMVQETVLVEHRILLPPGMDGEVLKIENGEYKVTDTIAQVRTRSGEIVELSLMQKWPVRKPRPYLEKLPPGIPLATGQRIIDMFFPVAKGGTACIPGPFGSGKTVVQQQLAKWSDADIIVYIGCGERGNEMADVLLEFPELRDPRSGEPLMKRTILIANTSNMPVAAREASIYTGITIAEYFRDMGYHVALMADSTSRWAEALREMSGRLEEMPGEEGYPAYLPTRLADFYERAGLVKVIGSHKGQEGKKGKKGEECQEDRGRIGSLSAIGAVSPPGGDMSDPVVQATLKIVKVFWGLDSNLAYRRHFPAINWLLSYSLYHDNLEQYFIRDQGVEDWGPVRVEAMTLLQKESELEEIVRLVGKESLSPSDQLILAMAKSIREDFLYQNAFHKEDSYTSLRKQYQMLKLIVQAYHEFQKALAAGHSLEKLLELPVMEKMARMKFLKEEAQAGEDMPEFGSYFQDLKDQVASLEKE